MTKKNALFALAVAVLMGCMAVAALADDSPMFLNGPESSPVYPGMEDQQPTAGAIRGPVETGSVPGSSDLYNEDTLVASPHEESGEVAIRPDIDFGP